MWWDTLLKQRRKSGNCHAQDLSNISKTSKDQFGVVFQTWSKMNPGWIDMNPTINHQKSSKKSSNFQSLSRVWRSHPKHLICETMIKLFFHKKNCHFRSENWSMYRYLLAHRPRLLGQARNGTGMGWLGSGWFFVGRVLPSFLGARKPFSGALSFIFLGFIMTI